MTCKSLNQIQDWGEHLACSIPEINLTPLSGYSEGCGADWFSSCSARPFFPHLYFFSRTPKPLSPLAPGVWQQEYDGSVKSHEVAWNLLEIAFEGWQDTPGCPCPQNGAGFCLHAAAALCMCRSWSTYLQRRRDPSADDIILPEAPLAPFSLEGDGG